MRSMEEIQRAKMRSDDRILILKPIDGTKPMNTIGLTDPRLFSGEASLHALRNPVNSLWGLRYTCGVLPQPLQQKFTRFDDLMDFAQNYYGKRNLKIVQVID